MPTLAALAILLSACASTTVTLTPPTAAPVCDARAAARVWWTPQWRADQKDVADREPAAIQGLQAFFTRSGCFASVDLQRAADQAQARDTARAALTATDARPPDKALVITLHELGPVLRLGASLALVDGGTEVKLAVDEFVGVPAPAHRHLELHWQHGGPGVVKGVATLPADLQAALAAVLQPTSLPR